MSEQTQAALATLKLYFKEKNLANEKTTKLTKWLKEGKKNKYKKRRDSWFPDYDKFVNDLVKDRWKSIDQQKSERDALVRQLNKTCATALVDFSKKAIATEQSLTIVDDTLAKVETQEATAVADQKLFAKLLAALDKKAIKEGTAKLAKLLSSARSAHEKAETAATLLKENRNTIAQTQKQLSEAKAQLAAMTKQATSVQVLAKETMTNLAGIADEIRNLRQPSTDKEAVLHSDIVKRLEAGAAVATMAKGQEQVDQLFQKAKELVTRFAAGTVLKQNEAALGKIRSALQRANQHWLNVSDTAELDFFDPSPYYAYYTNIWVYPQANTRVKGVAQEPYLKGGLDKSHFFVKKKGELVKLSSGGWCLLEDFWTQEQKERADYLNTYTSFLEKQYEVMDDLKGQNKLDRIRGVLSQAQRVIRRFNKGNPLPVSSLALEPVYEEDLQQVTSPHELITPLREWIKLTESNIARVKAEDDVNTNAGSWYSNTDWNTLLRVPQYRTQSDNLVSPESTCAPTTFTMMAERAGWSRADMIEAIDQRFRDEGADNLERHWKNKGEKFLDWINANATKNYQKIQAGRLGKKHFEKVAENMREHAQFEDLTIFYHYLINSSHFTSINSSGSHNIRLQQGLENDGDFGKQGSYAYKKYAALGSDLATRKLVKDHLDQGDVVMFSIFHKGAGQSGTHNYFIQSITENGFVVDDPYGLGNTDYVRKSGVKSDLYKAKGGNKHRNDYDFKNRPVLSLLRKDFTMKAGQDLKDDESRGDANLLTWKMMMNSSSRIINYVVVWKKKGKA
ncbi:hypothetical protein [Lewinella cohaerens]|uniref:hypothetical protein n=1 Tax=Lewinella cohaerens TaxID=70995 RepID=UPI00035FEB5B|nr:hypothetical protein [Lewinella cohaerens]